VLFFGGILFDFLVTHFLLPDTRLTGYGVLGCIGGVLLGLGFAVGGVVLAFQMWFRDPE